jgi:uncharacterized OB-fold protein
MESEVSCPLCSSNKVRLIFWGMPRYRELNELLDAEEEGQVVFGGCAFAMPPPKWQCAGCGSEWGEVSVFEGFGYFDSRERRVVMDEEEPLSAAARIRSTAHMLAHGVWGRLAGMVEGGDEEARRLLAGFGLAIVDDEAAGVSEYALACLRNSYGRNYLESLLYRPDRMEAGSAEVFADVAAGAEIRSLSRKSTGFNSLFHRRRAEGMRYTKRAYERIVDYVGGSAPPADGPRCPKCGGLAVSTFDQIPGSLEGLMPKAYKDSYYCYRCASFIDASNLEQVIDSAEVKRRFRANMRWMRQGEEKIEEAVHLVEMRIGPRQRVNCLDIIMGQKRIAAAPVRWREAARAQSKALGLDDAAFGVAFTTKPDGRGEGAAGWLFAGSEVVNWRATRFETVPLFGHLTPEQEKLVAERVNTFWKHGRLSTSRDAGTACPKCGARIAKGTSLCADCGTRLSPAPAMEVPNETDTTLDYPHIHITGD